MAPITASAGQDLDDEFTGMVDADGLMTVTGFGSLLSERSSRTTFPDLTNFRQGKVRGYRRVFAHTAAIFFIRGIAKPETTEISSLSCEEFEGEEIVVTMFEVPIANKDAIKAFIEREHEFRFVAVAPLNMDGTPSGKLAVLCARWNDAAYQERRCPPEEWKRRYLDNGIDRVWRDDVLPCRMYLRHCLLAAKGLSRAAYDSFLDHTYLSDRSTTIRAHLAAQPGIMEELPPPELASRYSG